MSDAEVRVLFERLAACARAALAAYDQVSQPADAEVEAGAMQRERFFWRLTLEYGVLSARRDLEWLEAVLARIQAGELPPPPKP